METTDTEILHNFQRKQKDYDFQLMRSTVNEIPVENIRDQIDITVRAGREPKRAELRQQIKKLPVNVTEYLHRLLH